MRKTYIFNDEASLIPINDVLNEARLALNQKSRTNADTSLNKSIVASLNTSLTSTVSFTSLFALSKGTTLANSFGKKLGPTVAAISLATLPIVGVASASAKMVDHVNLENFKTKKRELMRRSKKQAELLHQEALYLDKNSERYKYLVGLEKLLLKAENDLRQDLKMI